MHNITHVFIAWHYNYYKQSIPLKRMHLFIYLATDKNLILRSGWGKFQKLKISWPPWPQQDTWNILTKEIIQPNLQKGFYLIPLKGENRTICIRKTMLWIQPIARSGQNRICKLSVTYFLLSETNSFQSYLQSGPLPLFHFNQKFASK